MMIASLAGCGTTNTADTTDSSVVAKQETDAIDESNDTTDDSASDTSSTSSATHLTKDDITVNETYDNSADGDHAIEADGTDEEYSDKRHTVHLGVYLLKDGEKQKASHVVVDVPSTFSKEQKEILKEYVTQMGGTYTNMKIVETDSDGNQNISFPAKIEFGKDAAYTPEVCAKMLLGEGKENLIKEILETNAAYNQKRQITQDKEKKMSNSNDNQQIAFGKKGGLKL